MSGIHCPNPYLGSIKPDVRYTVIKNSTVRVPRLTFFIQRGPTLYLDPLVGRSPVKERVLTKAIETSGHSILLPERVRETCGVNVRLVRLVPVLSAQKKLGDFFDGRCPNSLQGPLTMDVLLSSQRSGCDFPPPVKV